MAVKKMTYKPGGTSAMPKKTGPGFKGVTPPAGVKRYTPKGTGRGGQMKKMGGK